MTLESQGVFSKQNSPLLQDNGDRSGHGREQYSDA
eukprot:CAMPEP_0172332148 /NCGR_PEP_ID=MMETSP1058-20130122/62289_1 /TAXON_ID=83371 /ORGANISM="Detonula confervacea, Strain CCMP 353" /LENGTH=34 /DNA_ID= /DNA_START= /DNA_END= /DNA_ORIENTATION=